MYWGLFIIGLFILILSGIALGDLTILYKKPIKKSTKPIIEILSSIGIAVGSLLIIFGFIKTSEKVSLD